MKVHPAYAALVERAVASHERNRSPEGITDDEIVRARLYAYGFRVHTIGAFHATRTALESIPPACPTATAWRVRTEEALRDLANLAMDPVPTDFRVVVATFARYHAGVSRVLDGLERELQCGTQPSLRLVADRFRAAMEAITGQCGIHLARDDHAPEQASFVVPNLGIVIVPLVYGDHHSWNLAHLGGAERNVPTHRHHDGVEIHLGFAPSHGRMILGGYATPVDEGYALPIPPETNHGWVNTSAEPHHVPFVFGSLRHGGWGVFLDVEAAPTPVSELRVVGREDRPFQQTVYLEREIESAARTRSALRRVLIPSTVTNRGGRGGLELAVTRVTPGGLDWPQDSFRAVSVVRGMGRVAIEGIEREVGPHDHFGVPEGMRCTLSQTGDAPLVTLDALIRGLPRG